MHRQYGDRTAPDDPFGDGAQQQVSEAAAPVGAHDDEITAEVRDGLTDGFGFREAANQVWMDDGPIGGIPGIPQYLAGPLVLTGHDAFKLSVVLLLVMWIFQENPHVEEVNLCGEDSGELEGRIEGQPGRVRKICWHENPLDWSGHRNLPEAV